jgi:mRNA interferase MazF
MLSNSGEKFAAGNAFVSGDWRTSRWCTVEVSSHRLGSKSVMSVREKRDEKNWEDGSDYGTAGAERLQNLSTVTVAPVTSTIRGVPSEVVLNEEDGMKSPCAVNLHNAVTVSQQRLGRRLARLSAARMYEVCAALRFSLGCDSN